MSINVPILSVRCENRMHRPRSSTFYTRILTNTHLLRLEIEKGSPTEAPIQDLSSSNTSPRLNVFGLQTHPVSFFSMLLILFSAT